MNPLLGHWRLSNAEVNPAAPGAASGCLPELLFSPSDLKLKISGRTVTNAASFYNVGPKDVFIIGSGANPVIYNLLDRSDIVQCSGYASCYYTKS